MTSPRQSSGNLTADKRAAYAHMLGEADDFQAAAELMAQALELAPLWAAGWFQLAGFQERGGQTEAAQRSYEQVLKIAPADIFGAALRLAHLRGEQPETSSTDYVEALFDDYAARFDKALVETLAYRAPQLLAGKIANAAPGRLFRSAIDLGCGTGLMIEALPERPQHATGIDLSEAMLGQARAKGLYDRLEKSDLVSGLSGCGPADLMLAADVYMYLSDLDAVTNAVAATLEDGGFYAFSVELHDGDEPFVLRKSLRHAHSRPYVNALLAAHGFTLIDQSEEDIRKDGREMIRGLITLATRHGRR